MEMLSSEGRRLRVSLRHELHRLNGLRRRAVLAPTAEVVRLCGDINRDLKRLTGLEPENRVALLGREAIYNFGRKVLLAA